MRDQVKWASGRASIHERVVGPRHDPYTRVTVSLRLNNKDFNLVNCALAGDWFEEVDARTVTRLAAAPIHPSPEEKQEFERVVTAMTQFDSDFWMDGLWGRVRAHRSDNYYDFDGIYM